MARRRFQPITPAGQLSAGELARLGETAGQLSRPRGGPDVATLRTAGGLVLARPPLDRFRARLTGGPDGDGAYHWTTAVDDRDAPGRFLDDPELVTGRPRAYPAYEANRVDVRPGTVVWLRRGLGDYYLFEHCCTGYYGRGYGGGGGVDTGCCDDVPVALTATVVRDEPGYGTTSCSLPLAFQGEVCPLALWLPLHACAIVPFHGSPLIPPEFRKDQCVCLELFCPVCPSPDTDPLGCSQFQLKLDVGEGPAGHCGDGFSSLCAGLSAASSANPFFCTCEPFFLWFIYNHPLSGRYDVYITP
jgi:hypothetical protein